tara:strand:- start:270 stop:455 length:186 start_codon:yes stop_codon:yes gene_type:complete
MSIRKIFNINSTTMIANYQNFKTRDILQLKSNLTSYPIEKIKNITFPFLKTLLLRNLFEKY